MNLQDKVFLVTGGAHRVGKAIALALAAQGAKLAITYNASAELAQKTCLEIEALGTQALALRCDQSDFSQIQGALEAVTQYFGRLDGLVNSASIMQEVSNFFDVTPADWDLTMNVNARGPFFFTQAAARWMLAHDGGVVVNIIDDSAVNPGAALMQHGASKTALWMITRSSALALAPSIRVNAVLPGAVLKPPAWSEERWQNIAPSVPLKRLGAAEDVARAVAYLIKEDYITGQVIIVDGGSSLRG
jgi:NAD(P)-dependent dehydrogenase (short-subunit alcohol dehydrogenase family)